MIVGLSTDVGYCYVAFEDELEEMSHTTNKEICKKCLGTGIESYFNHGHGEESVESIRCEDCEGFGVTNS